jgi:type II secretory pathway component GspD/PulD (secretin)
VKQSREKLGDALVAMSAASQDDVLRALAVLFAPVEKHRGDDHEARPHTQTGAGPSLPPPGLIPGGGSLGGALATENKVNVLSSPSIRTSENKKAVLTQIGEQGTVSLDVKEEVNDVREAELSPINSPRIKNREADTSVVPLKNQTLVLGGLIQSKRAFIRTGIPFLNRIPVLGYLVLRKP